MAASKPKMSRVEQEDEYIDLEMSNEAAFFTDIMLKVLIIGDYGVGKTAIVRRYTEDKFSSNYKITIGAEFSLKSCLWNNFTQVNIQLWDIAGHERFGYMTRVYYKNASAAAIVFDVSRVQTFASVQKWLADIRDKVMLADGTPLPVVILANKTDIPGTEAPKDMLDRLSKEKDVIGWFSTSAKDNLNIGEAMGQLVECAMENRRKLREQEVECENIALHTENKAKKNWHCCS